MFPINFNDPYLKEDGSIVPISEVIGGGGGGSELPPHTVADAGKVLSIDENNNLVWVELPTPTMRTSVKVTMPIPAKDNLTIKQGGETP